MGPRWTPMPGLRRMRAQTALTRWRRPELRRPASTLEPRRAVPAAARFQRRAQARREAARRRQELARPVLQPAPARAASPGCGWRTRRVGLRHPATRRAAARLRRRAWVQGLRELPWPRAPAAAPARRVWAQIRRVS